MDYFRHDLAVVETPSVGTGTRIWAFAHVLPGARVGADCNICDHVFIENDVVVGDRVTIKSGVQLWDGVRLGDDVFVGPNVTFTNDPFPRSKAYPAKFPETVRQVRRLDRRERDHPAGPHHRARRDDRRGCGRDPKTCPRTPSSSATPPGSSATSTRRPTPRCGRMFPTGRQPKVRTLARWLARTESPFVGTVRGVTLHRLKRVDDLRGALVAGEIAREIPFEVRRFFVVFDVTNEQIRGEHAHRTLHQFLVCLRGRVHVMVDDGKDRAEFVLDSPTLGVHLPPMVWGSQFRYSPDAILLVLASDFYRPEDYIRSYREFLEVVGGDDGPRR